MLGRWTLYGLFYRIYDIKELSSIYYENNKMKSNKQRLFEVMNKLNPDFKITEERLHTLEDAKFVLNLIRDKISNQATLIGGFGKGKTTSMHDIDILIPNKDISIKNNLMQLLNAESVESTDWGGLYYNNTPYGDVDIFFTTEDFDY